MAGVNFRNKFDELFGEEAVTSAPTLRDVAPGLINPGGARFTSKELNTRRSAVSARSFRNPRVRSAEGAFEGKGPVAPAYTGDSGFSGTLGPGPDPMAQGIAAGDFDAEGNFIGGPTAALPGGTVGSNFNIGPGGGDVGPAGGAAGTAMGNMVAGEIGTGLGMSALTAGAGALGMGATAGQAANFGIGSAMGSLITPIGMLNLANTVGGGVAASQLGYNTTGGLNAEGLNVGTEAGFSATEVGQQQAAGAEAASSSLGLVGMAAKGIGSLIGITESPKEAAEKAAFNEVLNQEIAFFEGGEVAGGTGMGGAQGIGTGTSPGGAAADAFTDAFPSTGAGSGTSSGSIGSVAGAAGEGGFVEGLFQSGLQAEQGGPVTGNSVAAPSTGGGLVGGGSAAGAVGSSGQSAGSLGIGNPGSYGGDGGGGGGGK